MPLEPSAPGSARRLPRSDGPISAVTIFLVIGGLLAVIVLFGPCMFLSGRGGTSVSPIERGLARTTAQLNVTSALKDAAKAQKHYFATHFRFSTDEAILTEGGHYAGVTIRQVSVTDNSFCLEAAHGDLPRTWHIGAGMKEPRRGTCS